MPGLPGMGGPHASFQFPLPEQFRVPHFSSDPKGHATDVGNQQTGGQVSSSLVDVEAGTSAIAAQDGR